MRGLGSKTKPRLVWIIAILILLLAGVGYRVLAERLKLIASTPIRLSVSLSHFPLFIGAWQGKDVPLALNIQRTAGNDDYVNRLYINREDKSWVNLYVAYTARPRTMTGHRPQVCYPAGGWVHDSTESSEVISQSGRRIPCLIHRFHKASPENELVVVLNFYVVNGQLTNDESVFSGIGWRTPNINGNPARYAAQVQISSVLESSVRLMAGDIVNTALDILPDDNGKVRASEYSRSEDGVLK
jgi:EpsI family protein